MNTLTMYANFEEFKLFCKVECFMSQHTISAYEIDCLQFIELCEEQSLEKNIYLYQDWLNNQSLTKKTIIRKISSIKNFMRFCVNEYQCSETILKCFPKLSFPTSLPKVCSVHDIELLLSFPNKSTKQGYRDFLLLDCLYSTGMRVSECVNLMIKDVNLSDGFIVIKGKGNKVRHVPLTKNLYQSFLSYFNSFQCSSIYIFDSLSGKPLSRQGAYLILKKYVKQLPSRLHYLTPHSLRHAFATHIIEGGARLRDTQLLLGHQHLSSTQIYTRVSKSYQKKVFLQSHPRGSV